MKTKIKIFAVLLLVCFSLTGKAQSTMQINKQDGSKVNINKSDVRKLTFPSGSLEITKFDGSVISYVLTDVKFINFASISSSTHSVSGKDVQALQLYYNPVVKELKLNLSEINTKSAEVSVINSFGIILFIQIVENDPVIRISVSTLPHGVYFCVVKADGKTSVGKFIK